MTEHHGLTAAELEAVQRLAELVGRLHDPDTGCPWCLEQTHTSMRDYAIDEAHEVAEAIDSGDPARLADELGDLLALVLTHTELARQQGDFNLTTVAGIAADKTVRRNPHIFGSARATTAAEVLRQWEAQKRAERPPETSILSGVKHSLPALIRAQQLRDRAAHVGFDWPDAAAVREKVDEELTELKAAPDEPHQREELGDLLFALVNLAHHLGFSAEQALQEANNKFTRRFQDIEEACRAQGRLPEDLDLAELDALWNQAKQRPIER
jgi:ATP diphosphatase